MNLFFINHRNKFLCFFTYIFNRSQTQMYHIMGIVVYLIFLSKCPDKLLAQIRPVINFDQPVFFALPDHFLRNTGTAVQNKRNRGNLIDFRKQRDVDLWI